MPAPPTTVLIVGEARLEIALQVINGGNEDGAAMRFTDRLRLAGFRPLPPEDALVDVDATTVIYAPRAESEAFTVNQFAAADPDHVIEARPDDPNWLRYGAPLEGAERDVPHLDVLIVIGPTPG